MQLDRTNIEDLKFRLQLAGSRSKKRLGQHFLVDRTVLGKIIEAAELQPTDTVVEIGPGPGVLSELLLENVQRVVAFELDFEMIKILRVDFPKLELIEGDVLDLAREVVPTLPAYKVVANIPYQITTPLLRLFLEGGVQPRPTSLTLMVQKEVGERLTAPAAKSGRGYLSVLAEYYASLSYITTVPRSAFWPVPKVDSAVIQMVLKSERLFDQTEEPKFLRFVHNLFKNPRKQLKNVAAGIRGESVEGLWSSLGFTANIRAQELSLTDWSNLYRAWK